jgi:hypothetical protein
MPTIVSDAFDVIADEANEILKENHGGSTAGSNNSNEAQ